MSHDAKYQRLAEIADDLKNDTIPKTAKREKDWENSPFQWLAARWVPPAPKASVGRTLVRGLCKDAGLSVERHRTGDRTRIRVEGQVIAVKFSLLGEDGKYLFQNIQGSGYKFLFCLGVSPSCAHAWVIPIEKIRDASHQHGKADKWIHSVDPNNPPNILRDNNQSGDIGEVCETFRRYLEQSSK